VAGGGECKGGFRNKKKGGRGWLGKGGQSLSANAAPGGERGEERRGRGFNRREKSLLEKHVGSSHRGDGFDLILGNSFSKGSFIRFRRDLN